MLFLYEFLLYRLKDYIIQNGFEIDQIPSYIQFYRVLSLVPNDRSFVEYHTIKDRLFDFINNTQSDDLPLSIRIHHNLARYFWYTHIDNQKMKVKTINSLIIDLQNRFEDLTEIQYIFIFTIMIKEKKIFLKNPQFCNSIKTILRKDRRFILSQGKDTTLDLKDKLKFFIVSYLKREYEIDYFNINNMNPLESADFRSENYNVQNKSLCWFLFLWLEIYLYSKKQNIVLNITLKDFIKEIFKQFLLNKYNSISDLGLIDDGVISLFHKLLLLESQTEKMLKEKDWFSTVVGKKLFPIEDKTKIPERILRIINTSIGLYCHGFYSASAIFIRKTIESALIVGFQMMRRENDLRETDGRLKKLDSCFDLLLRENLITKSQRSRMNQCKALADEAVHNFRIDFFSEEEVENSFQIMRFFLINYFIEVHRRMTKSKK